MIVGTLSVRLMIRDARSLKDKRRVLKSLKDRLKNNFNVSVAEVDLNDIRQQAVLGLASVGNDNRFINQTLSNIIKFIRAVPLVEIIDCRQECFSE
ncbi:MAG: DUF503 domain-containing protein [Planctomycetes bacterium]|nr:DUF503 domain-containing protein [Planctomycetota bacterium]